MRAFLIASAAMAAGLGLSGCAVYDVASTAVDVTTTVIGTAVDVAGAVIPYRQSDADKKSKDD